MHLSGNCGAMWDTHWKRQGYYSSCQWTAVHRKTILLFTLQITLHETLYSTTFTLHSSNRASLKENIFTFQVVSLMGVHACPPTQWTPQSGQWLGRRLKDQETVVWFTHEIFLFFLLHPDVVWCPPTLLFSTHCSLSIPEGTAVPGWWVFTSI